MTVYSEDIYWEDANYVKWDQNELTAFNLNDEDIHSICSMGLPDWVAPNISFEIYEPDADRLKLGEDRNDRDIYISINNGAVYVGKDEQFMNSSVYLLRKALQLYAVMVEKALEIDTNSVVENRVHRGLVRDLEIGLCKLDPECTLNGNFWSEEIKRLHSQNI